MNCLARLASTLLCMSTILLSSCTQHQIEEFERASQYDGAVGVTAQALTAAPVYAVADTVVRSAAPFANDGTGLALGVTAWSVADIKRSIVRFDTAEIKSRIGAAPNALWSARLELTATSFSAGSQAWSGGGIDVLRMTQPWQEGNGLLGHGASWVCSDDKDTTLAGNLADHCTAPSIKWSMTAGGPNPLPYVSTATARAPIFTGGPTTISFDVTNDVQAFINGTANNGWMVAGAANLAGGQWIDFASRESSTVTNRPRLIIEYGADQCLANSNKGAAGVCGCDILDVDTNGDRVPDCFDATIVASADTALRLPTPTANDGKGLFLPATSASIVNLERSLVRFDTAAINAARGTRRVNRAYLDFTVAGIAADWLNGQVSVSRMTHDWGEGTGLDGSLPGGGASWTCSNDMNTTLLGNAVPNAIDCLPQNHWGMQVVDLFSRPYVMTETSRQTIAWPNTANIRFDVTEDVRNYIDDPMGFVFPNYGWIVQGSPSGLGSGTWINFGSRETGAPPRLLLDFDPPCPEGSNGDDDFDLVPECLDKCPFDTNKSAEGVCGCNKSERDSDNDKIPDCIDPDPGSNNTAIGGGCGTVASPAPAGTPCSGVCGGSGKPDGLDTCNGAGVCGNPSTCSTKPFPDCVPIVTKFFSYWWCPTTGRSYTTAETACARTPGQSLPRILNESQNALLRSFITADTWTAASDQHTEGTWRWTRGNTTSAFWIGNQTGAPNFGRYSNWAAGQPSNAAAANDCGGMSFASTTGTWTARPCTDALRVMCVRSLETGGSGTLTGGGGSGGLDVPPPPTTCELYGTCPKPLSQTGACIDLNATPSAVPGAVCPDTDPRCAAARTAETQLRNCDLCMYGRPAGGGLPAVTAQCTTGTSPATCRSRCASSCGGAATLPASTLATTCEPFNNYEPVSTDPDWPIQPDLEQRCTLQSYSTTRCSSHSQCNGRTDGNTHCGYAFYCSATAGQKTDAPGTPCTPTVSIGTTGIPPRRADLCAAGTECIGDLFCGKPIDECATQENPNEPCVEYDMCLDPDDDIAVVEDTNTALLAPQPFDAAAAFGSTPASVPAKSMTGTFPADPACNDTGCSAPNNRNHKYCRHEPDGTLATRKPMPPDRATGMSGTGPSKSLSFDFDPKLQLEYGVVPGPLGMPMPNLSATASLTADATVNMFGFSIPVQIMDMAVGARGGMKMDLRPADPRIDDAAEFCGISSSAHATILSIDVLPASSTLNRSLPDRPTQRRCMALVRNFTEAADRARKAYADARELRTAYDNMIAAGRNYGAGVAYNGQVRTSLCQLIAADPPGPKTGDYRFPGSANCATEKPETTINRFIWYADVTVQRQLQDAKDMLLAELDSTINLSGPVLDIPVINEHEEITLFNQTFMVGPVPVNLEIGMPVTYGVDVSFIYDLKLGRLVGELLGGRSPNPEIPFAKMGIDGAPYAGAGITLFAGVGFDIGFAAAKIGIEGAVDLGRVSIPVTGWAGVGVATKNDPRTLSTTAAAQVYSASGPMIPTQQLMFTMLYGYEVSLNIDHVLDGALNAKLKLKFFWFSRTYRKRIVKFNGFCRTDGTPRQPWCKTVLFSSAGQPGWDWGTIQMPLPFFPLRIIENFSALPPTGSFSEGSHPVRDFFYDDLCQCIPTWDLANPTDKPCYRNSDCCSGADECTPIASDGAGVCTLIGPE